MNTTPLGIVLGLLLLAVPIYFIVAFRLQLMGRFLKSMFRLLLFMSVTGILIYLVYSAKLVWVNILAMLLLTVLSALFTIGNARLRKLQMAVPVFFGLLPPLVIVVLYVGFLVLNCANPFAAQVLLPLTGIFAGLSIGSNAKALSVYYMGLQHHHQLYYYLLGNGASHREAVNYFLRRSLQASLLPSLGKAGGVMVAVCPVIFWTALLSGCNPLQATVLQVVLLIASMAVISSSLVLTLFLARRYSFDEYDRLKSPKRVNKESASSSSVEPTVSSTSPTASSATSETSDDVSSETFDARNGNE